jgi:hypothetical protein
LVSQHRLGKVPVVVMFLQTGIEKEPSQDNPENAAEKPLGFL